MMKKFCLALCFILATSGLASYAAPSVINISTCFLDPTTRVVTIEGTVTQFNPGQRVTLRVLNPGMELSDFGKKTAVEVFNYIGQTDILSDGSFMFEYEMTGVPNYYNVILSTDNATENVMSQISYVDVEQVNRAVAMLNDSQRATTEGLFAFLLLPETQFLLAMDMSFFNTISSLEEVCGLLTTHPRVVFEDADDFREKLRATAIVQAINEASNAETVSQLIKTYATDLGFDTLKRYTLFLSDNSIKEYVSTRMLNRNIVRAEMAQNIFEESIILGELANMTGYPQFPLWLSNNNNFMNLSLTTYNSLKNKAPVHKAIAGINYASIYPDLQNAFNTAVANQYTAETSAGKGGGGGTGGTNSGVVKNITQFFADSDENIENTLSSAVTQSQGEHGVYNDIQGVEWAHESIAELTEMAVLEGDGNGNFRPNVSVKREEFVKMIMVVFQLHEDSTFVDYTDVHENEWYYSYVASASAKNIVVGYEDGTFGIGKNISRQDMAVLLARVVEYTGMYLPPKREAFTFSDNHQFADYAVEAIETLYVGGAINGFEDGRFAPNQNATRAESAKMIFELHRAVEQR